MKKLLVSVFILTSLCAYTQELPKVIPPSPETSSFMKFVEAPVNKHTGLPTINIPIHVIDIDEINIPISLNYHAQGITVEELSSRVGIGWSLNAGGAISRKIVGRADEDPNLGLCSVSDLLEAAPTSKEARYKLLQNEINVKSTSYFLPDEFSFSFPGNSGKFIIDYTTKTPLLKNFDDLSIINVGAESSCAPEGYRILDKMGNVYHFGKVGSGSTERVAHSSDQTLESGVVKGGAITLNQDSSFYPSMNSPINTWHLLQIDTYKGKKVEFFYNVEKVIFKRRSYDEPGMTAYSKIISKQMQLSEIRYDSKKIKFISDTYREDLLGGKALDKIEIYNNSTLIKEYDLIHSYANSGTSGLSNVEPFYDDLEARKRLVLEKVQQKKGTEKLPAYKFTYSEVNLPHRFSNSQDSWGYFNNAPNGRYLVYELTSPDYSRRVNVNYSEAGMLTSIKYPTGGTLNFEYEHNKVQKPSFWDTDIATASINPKNKVVTTFTKHQNMVRDGVDYKGYFQNTAKSINRGKYSINCKTSSNDDDTSCDYIYYIIIDGTTLTLNNGSSGSLDFTKGWGIFDTNIPIEGFTVIAHPLSTNRDPNFRTENFRIDITSYIDEGSGTNTLFGPGKRIKKTSFNDNINKTTLVKEYSYIDSDGRSSGRVFGLPLFYDALPENNTYVARIRHSSGGGNAYASLFGRGVGYFRVTEYVGDSINNIGKTEYEFSNTIDSGGGYWRFPYHTPNNNDWLRGKNLRTLFYGVNNQGNYTLKKEIINTYKFADGLDLDLIKGERVSNGIPQLPIPNFPPFESSNFHENTPAEYQYSADRKFFKIPLIHFSRTNGYATNVSSTSLDSLNYKIYHYTGGALNLTKTKETNYLENGSVTSETNYFYNYNQHYQANKIKTSNSKGKIIYSETQYPQDKPNLTAVEQDLKLKHRFVPLTSRNYLDINADGILADSELLSTQNTIYKDWGNSIILPNKIQILKGSPTSSNIVEDRVIYHNYDAKGNPIEVSKKDGTKIYYVWGYQQTQPIAKIEGYTSINLTQLSYINQAISASNSDDDTCLDSESCDEKILRDKLTLLRNSFSTTSAQVTTYTYNPLIGVTSITDPRGETMYYEYDNFNRLQYVKDANGNILKENVYNYKN